MLDIHAEPVGEATPITTAETVLSLQQRLPSIHVSDEIRAYIVDLARHSREHVDVALGASPRAALYLMHAARARSVLRGRSYVTHEDVQAMLKPVLGHRLILQPEAEVEGRNVNDVIQEIADKVPVTPSSSVEQQ